MADETCDFKEIKNIFLKKSFHRRLQKQL